MKYLYEIPRESKIYAELSDGSTWLTFNHLDGMYSYCTTEKGGAVHLSVGTQLVEYKDGYKLAGEEDHD